MVATVSFQPFVQTSGNAGLFNAFSTGLRQGTAYPDPSTRWALRTGILASSETIPMWGGVGIYENVPGGVSNVSDTGEADYVSTTLGPVVGRATGLTGSKALAGFSVFDQAHGMITSPQSIVPLAGSGMQVMSYRLGSGARIAVDCDPILVDLQGGPIGAQVSWDFVNQLLVPYLGTITISTGGTYNNTTGVITLVLPSTGFSAGDSVVISSLTGTGAYASLDGTWTVLSVTGTTGCTLQGPVGVGASTITGGSLTLGSGSDVALPCSVLDVQTTNCMTVSYNATTGFATWNFNGCCAVIQI